MWNDKSIMTVYQNQPTKVGGLISDKMSLRREIVCLRLGLKDRLESFIFNLNNVYYLPNSFYSLVSLRFLNNSKIFHNNKFKNFY